MALSRVKKTNSTKEDQLYPEGNGRIVKDEFGRTRLLTEEEFKRLYKPTGDGGVTKKSVFEMDKRTRKEYEAKHRTEKKAKSRGL